MRAMQGNASSNEFSRKSPGKLPETHTYVWHLRLTQQSVRHELRNAYYGKTFKNPVDQRGIGERLKVARLRFRLAI